MKKQFLWVSAVLFCLASAVVSAAPKGDNSDQDHVIPVLVSVNAQGQVTDASPAYKLRPAFVHLIRDTLNKMITQPAMSDGEPTSCQFVVHLAMVTEPLGDGKYNTTFKVLRSKALPTGSWYWVRTQDHRLTLEDQRTNRDINLANVTSERMRESNMANQEAAMIHEQFMNQVNQGRH